MTKKKKKKTNKNLGVVHALVYIWWVHLWQRLDVLCSVQSFTLSHFPYLFWGQGWTFLFLPICCGWLAARFPPQLPPTPPASPKKKSNRCRIFVHILLRPWKRNCLIFPLPVCLPPPPPLLSRVSPPQRTYPAPAPFPVSKRGCCFWFSCFPPMSVLSPSGVCVGGLFGGDLMSHIGPRGNFVLCVITYDCVASSGSFPFPPNPSPFFPARALDEREREGSLSSWASILS